MVKWGGQESEEKEEQENKKKDYLSSLGGLLCFSRKQIHGRSFSI